jgi:hypothetical protein
MRGKKTTVRWLRTTTAAVAIPICCVVVGVPVLAILWLSVMVLVASMFMGLRLDGGTKTRSIAEIIRDLDAESRSRPMPIPVRVTSAVSTPRPPLQGLNRVS